MATRRWWLMSPFYSPCSERVQWEKEHGEYHSRQSRSPSPHGYHYHHGRQSACDYHVTVMWLSCDCHVTVMWLSCDYHVTVMWLSCPGTQVYCILLPVESLSVYDIGHCKAIGSDVGSWQVVYTIAVHASVLYPASFALVSCEDTLYLVSVNVFLFSLPSVFLFPHFFLLPPPLSSPPPPPPPSSFLCYRLLWLLKWTQ